ncbi:MAG TPA: NnrS family protein [Pseudomonadales bacterium]
MSRPGEPTAGRVGRPPFANALFFPAAAVYGAVAVPWWVLGLAGLVPVLPGLATPIGHGHEMLFGYAFAVVAGYLLGPQPLGRTLPLLGLWLVARAGFLLWPGSWFALAAVALFAGITAAEVVPRFGRAKKWRNLTVVPVVAGFAVLAATGSAWFGTSIESEVLTAALVLLGVLMFFMGGRIIAPAIAGHVVRHGGALDARVQPALEGVVLVALFGALVLLAVPEPRAGAAAGLLIAAAGALTGVRAVRWRPWHCFDRPDLLILVLGYAWLAFGLLALGAALWSGRSVQGALHALAVGALGTLTVAVMARTRLLYRFRDANRMPAAHWAALLMSVAALARLGYASPWAGEWGSALLAASATCWSAALLGLLAVLAAAEWRFARMANSGT